MPPKIRARLFDEGFVNDCDVIDSELLKVTVKRAYHDSALRERLFAQAGRILEDFFETPGWGTWPIDLSEALYVGSVLGIWIEQAMADSICELPEEELAAFEAESRRTGRSLERICLDALCERKDHDH